MFTSASAEWKRLVHWPTRWYCKCRSVGFLSWEHLVLGQCFYGTAYQPRQHCNTCDSRLQPVRGVLQGLLLLPTGQGVRSAVLIDQDQGLPGFAVIALIPNVIVMCLKPLVMLLLIFYSDCRLWVWHLNKYFFHIISLPFCLLLSEIPCFFFQKMKQYFPRELS